MVSSLKSLLAILATAAVFETKPATAADEAPPSHVFEAAPEVAPSSISDPPVALTWVAPPDCPGIDALRAEIRRVAGSVPPPEERLTADVTVQRGPGEKWQLTLATRTGTRAGERRLAGADCAELMRAAALVVALMINPAAGQMLEAPAKPQAAPPPMAVAVALPTDPTDRQIAAGVEFLLGTGALPSVAPGVGVRLAVKHGAFSGEIRGGMWAERTVASLSDGATGGSFRLLDVGVAACVSARRDRRLSPAVCAGAAVSRLSGTGYGVTDPGAASAWWNAAFVEGSVRLRVTMRHGLRLAAQTLTSLGRPAFALAGVGPVFQPAWIWVRGTIGWEVIF